MSTDHKKDQTEELIKQTAKKIFFRDGKFKASTQEIADAAGVNRTLINYYFRSRDNLFQIVFDEAMFQENEKSKSIMNSTLPFKTKLGDYIEYAINSALEYPYLENYIVSELNAGQCYKHQDDFDEAMIKLKKEYQNFVEKGEVPNLSFNQFLLNVAALISFPISMRPLLQNQLKISKDEYTQLLKERKQIILNTLFPNLNN